MIEKLVEQIESRFGELSEQMSDPAVISDRERYAEVGRAYSQLEPAHELAREYRQAADDAAGARELLSEDGDDAELRELLETSEARIAELDEEIRLAMVERDPNDDKNVIVEIRAGTGGEEAGLFAGDLYRMLTRYAERRGFKTEPLSVADATLIGVTYSRKFEHLLQVEPADAAACCVGSRARRAEREVELRPAAPLARP